MLHVSSVDKKSAGKYKCYVYNHADVLSSDDLESNEFNRTIIFDQSKSKTITLTYEPDPATNIAFFIMVGSSFCIAFVINLVGFARWCNAERLYWSYEKYELIFTGEYMSVLL